MTSHFRTALLLLPLALAPAADAQTTLIRGANVFDGTRMIGVRDVLLRDGLIAALGATIAAPGNATVVDARGHTLLPGLIDAHTHTFGDVLRQALAFGVTTQLEMFTDPALAARLRAEQAAGSADGRADIFSAGVLVTAPRGHGTQFGMAIPTIGSADSAQSFVDARIAEGSDFIKIVYDDGTSYALSRPTLDRATMCAVVDAAHRRGKLAVVHVHGGAFARDAIACGADGLVHVHADRDEATDAEFLTLARAKGAFVIPTLSVNLSTTGRAGGADLATDARIDSALSVVSAPALKQAFPTRPGTRARYAYAESTVAKLDAAGVAVLAGTDAPNPGTTHGASMHGELELLVRAGLTPTEALVAATAAPAKAFRLSDRGRIAAGLRADLLLVAGDPTKDITATRAIAGIWKRGVRFDRAEYVKWAQSTRVVVAGGGPPGSESGEISGFDDGSAGSKFGSGWQTSTDQMAGGKSVGEVGVVTGGAAGTSHSLRVRGTVDGSIPYAWSGAAFGPGVATMQPANLSAKKELVFHARGDGRTYRVMLFSQSRGMTPMIRTFIAGSDWREHVFPFSAFGTDARDVVLIVIAAGPEPGAFELFVDEVKLR